VLATSDSLDLDERERARERHDIHMRERERERFVVEMRKRERVCGVVTH